MLLFDDLELGNEDKSFYSAEQQTHWPFMVRTLKHYVPYFIVEIILLVILLIVIIAILIWIYKYSVSVIYNIPPPPLPLMSSINI